MESTLPSTGPRWPANGLASAFHFGQGAFAGAFRCNVLAAELHELERMLPVVKRDLVAYSWWTAERNIALELTPSRLGKITVSVELSDDPAWRKLSFEMAIDQSYLPRVRLIAKSGTRSYVYPLRIYGDSNAGQNPSDHQALRDEPQPGRAPAEGSRFPRRM
jgi:hypothetical protein